MSTKDGIKIALKLIGLAGLTGMVIVAPNAIQGLNLLIKKSPAKKANPERILAELKRQGLVHITIEEDEIHYTLTPAGASRLQKIMIDEISIPRPKKWDKKWRMVSFDIPVRYSKQRAHFTEQLQNLGLAMVHKSLWAYPFPCFTELEQLAGYYNVLRFCKFLEISQTDSLTARQLLRRFDSFIPT